MGHTIGVLLFEGAEELDYAGPWEVFGMAVRREEGSRVVALAETTAPLRSAKGLRVVPDVALAEAPDLDVLVVPGGRGVRSAVESPALLEFVATQHGRVRYLASVCTGAALLVAAGPARGRRVATHWSYVDELASRGECTVEPELRFVRDGDVVTAAGVSAGIDMSLWLVGELWDVEHAREVERQIQYDPAPPYRFDV